MADYRRRSAQAARNVVRLTQLSAFSTLVFEFVAVLLLAVVARVIAVGLGVENTIGILDLALVSVAGGLLASLVVLGATLLL